MKKNVAIVSFINVENYGAILQALALQEKVNDLGHNAFYINYGHQSPIKGVKRIVNIVWSLFRYLFGYGNRQRKTNIFRNKYFLLTKRIKSYDDLQLLPKFDFYLVGSDQVWNPSLISVSHGYYLLNFVPEDSKKISYASSFGTINIPEKAIEIYKKELAEFEKISVREVQGALFLKSIGIESKVVIDPTLLLDTESWKNYFPSKRKINEAYIFCYVMNGDHKGADFIKLVSKQIIKSKKRNYKVIVVGDKEYKKLIPGYHLITDAGPEDFLNLLYNADYVITNSFHGACFSINFNKEFIPVLNRDNPLNTRITSLLEFVKLSDRILYTDMNKNLINLSKINYSDLNKVLLKLRTNSISFLTEAFK